MHPGETKPEQSLQDRQDLLYQLYHEAQGSGQWEVGGEHAELKPEAAALASPSPQLHHAVRCAALRGKQPRWLVGRLPALHVKLPKLDLLLGDAH